MPPHQRPPAGHIAYVHSAEGVDRLGLVDAEARTGPQILAQGADFYATVLVSQGTPIGLIEWDHPQMPWDGTCLIWLRWATEAMERLSAVNAP